MNQWTLKEIRVEAGTRAVAQYAVEGEWAKYFTPQRQTFLEIFDRVGVCALKEIPPSVLAVPFVCNILPAAWLCDAEIVAGELDADFMDHVEEIKNGYREMYPMLNFGGKLTATPVRNAPDKPGTTDAAAFFSGGADAWTTLLRHLDERPVLTTLWGTDMSLDDAHGWNIIWRNTQETADKFGLDAVAVKTDFRSVLDESELNKLAEKSGDTWWHGFQHGIGLISHATPLAWLMGLRTVYIASSFPASMKGTYTCASDPTIDNHVHFCGCGTVHDGYELNRQGKIAYILKRRAEIGKPISLRVCFLSSDGGNCCHCEKCYRTILELVSEGADPNEYGFVWDRAAIRRCRKDMQGRLTSAQFNVDQYYPPIQKRMEENKDRIANYEDYEWLLRFDFSRFNDAPTKILLTNLRKTSLWQALRKAKRVLLTRGRR